VILTWTESGCCSVHAAGWEPGAKHPTFQTTLRRVGTLVDSADKYRLPLLNKKMNFNSLTLAGRLTRDPELRNLPSGTTVCNCGIAVNRRFKGSDGTQREETLFVDFEIFGKRGEAFKRYHFKGDPAFIDGYLKLETWDDKITGAKRSKHVMAVENWEFADSKNSPNHEPTGEEY
jgi:single stranded DNA-binding protein